MSALGPIDDVLKQVAEQLRVEAKAASPSKDDEESKDDKESKGSLLADLAVEVEDIRGRYRANT